MAAADLNTLTKFLAAEKAASAAKRKASVDAHRAYMQAMVDRAMAAFDAACHK